MNQAEYDAQWIPANSLLPKDLKRIWIDSLIRLDSAIQKKINSGSIERYEADEITRAVITENDRYNILESGTILALNFPGSAPKVHSEDCGDGITHNCCEWVVQIATANPSIANATKKILDESKPFRRLFLDCLFEKLCDEAVYEFSQESEHNFLSLRLVHPDDYPAFGTDWQGLWSNRARYFESQDPPTQIYKWRGLEMSRPHKLLATALQAKGYMFAAEAPVFQPSREDKSYIRADLIIFHDGCTLVVEVDGKFHYEDPDGRPAKKAFERDRRRDRRWSERGFTSMRFTTSDVERSVDECVSQISNFFKSKT